MNYVKDSAALEKAIQASVDILKNRVPKINLMLSGGIDSGLLAALLKPDRVITVRLPYGAKYDEYGYAMRIVKHLGLKNKLTTIDLDDRRFGEVMEKAVKAIGRPVPHFNIFPLYLAFERLASEGVKDVVVGDGPDESMGGYGRHLVMEALYRPYEDALKNEALSEYEPMIKKVAKYKLDGLSESEAYAKLIGKPLEYVQELMGGENLINDMCLVDMWLMRPDMMAMSHGLANHFGIKIHAPYEYEECDHYMFTLPPEAKIHIEAARGKELLRYVARKYLPKDIAFRGHKVGGPLVPVNRIMNWDDIGEFDKSRYLKWQEEILEKA